MRAGWGGSANARRLAPPPTIADSALPSRGAPYPNWTAIGVNWLAGFDFEIKVIARIPN